MSVPADIPREGALVEFTHPTRTMRCIGAVIDGVSGDDKGNLFVTVRWNRQRFTVAAEHVTITRPAPEIAPSE